MGVTVKADSAIKWMLAEEADVETHLRRRFHVHLILIGCALGFVVAGAFGVISSDTAAGCAVSTEWCRAAVEHRSERMRHD